MRSFNDVWLWALAENLSEGQQRSPRSKPTLDIPARTVVVDMLRAPLTVKTRALSYQFMAAEAYWILTGDDQVSGIAPWNNRIKEFSDDGERFFGAYGPKIHGQLDYVVSKLRQDPDTRQAGLTLWRENPPVTKDIPCTISMFFQRRTLIEQDRSKVYRFLDMHVYMRSSDLWLGLPYDVFNFSMVAHLICCRLNSLPPVANGVIKPGVLYVTAASSHLYLLNKKQAEGCVVRGATDRPPTPTPEAFYVHGSELLSTLKRLRDAKPGDPLRWWER